MKKKNKVLCTHCGNEHECNPHSKGFEATFKMKYQCPHSDTGLCDICWWYEHELSIYKEALAKISCCIMPKMTISNKDVTKENMADLCMVIQDMAGIANSALKEGEKK